MREMVKWVMGNARVRGSNGQILQFFFFKKKEYMNEITLSLILLQSQKSKYLFFFVPIKNIHFRSQN